MKGFFVLRNLVFVCVMTIVASSSFGQAAIPRLISARELPKYLKYIVCTEQQLSHIHLLHGDYLRKWAESFNEEIRSFNSIWGSVYVDPQSFTGESMQKAFRQAREKAELLAAKLRPANDEFFDNVELILGEEQREDVQRMRLAHERFTYRREGDRGLRETQIDLVEIIEKMKLLGRDAELSHAFILEFEPVFVHTLRSAAEAHQRGEEYSFAFLDVIRQFPRSGPDPASRAIADELNKKAGKIEYGAARRLVEANRNGLGRLTNVLSDDVARDLKNLYNREAYPEVYPDPVSAEALFEAALRIADLSDEQRAALQVLVTEYRNQHELLSHRLARAIFDQRAAHYKGEGPGAWDKHAGIIKNAGFKREALNLKQPGIIKGVLSPEQQSMLPPWKFEETQPVRFWGRLSNLESDDLQSTEAAQQEAEEVAFEERFRLGNEVRIKKGLPPLKRPGEKEASSSPGAEDSKSEEPQ